MKNFNQKTLSTTVSMLMTLSIAVTTQAIEVLPPSDIQIYKLPDKTELTVFMMLDTSGSMDSSNSGVTTSACDLKSGQTSQGIVTGELSANGYKVNYCQLEKNGTKNIIFAPVLVEEELLGLPADHPEILIKASAPRHLVR